MATEATRKEIITLTVGLFGAAPGATFLSQFVNDVDAGLSVDGLASVLSQTSAFQSIYPSLLTDSEFATKFVNNLVGSEATAENKTWAANWMTGLLSGGATRSEAMMTAIRALDAVDATDANWGNASKALDNKVEVATWYSVDQLASSGDLATLQNVIASVTNDAATVTAITSGSALSGQTYTLTKGADTVSGTAFNDSISAVLSTTADNNTLNGLDIINGGAGTDTLTILDETGSQAIPATLQISNVETITARSAGTANIDVSKYTDVVALNVIQSGAATATAAATTDIKVSGATGAITVNGGKSVTVTDATADQAITVGNTTQTTGAISVTDSKQGTGNIVVDGGSDVAVTTTIAATTAAVAGGDVTVGATKAATGTSTVVQNLTSTGGTADAHDLTAANIAVTGGTAIDITVNATSTAANENADGDIAIGTVAATADTKTTSISAVQNATATTSTKAAVAVVKETSAVTFEAMTSGQTLIVNGLTFTAAKDLTKEQVAQAFSNIAENGTIGGAGTGNGTYTGTFNTAVWSSAAANGAVVTFTAQDHDETDLVFTGTASAPTQVKTAGTAAATEVKSTNEVTFGTVTINDNATAASVTDVTVNGYANGSTIGGTNATTKLANLSLANAAASASMVVADTADTLALSLEKVGSATADAVVTLTAAPKTLNVTSTGDNFVNLTAAATEALTVSGTGTLDADATDLAALKTVTVSGTAGLKLNAGVSDTVTSVDASATSGSVTVAIDGSKATYVGSTGADTVTLATATALTKAINTGAGDDTVVFGAAVTGSTAALNAGEGTDTLSMTVANAAALDASVQTFYTGFERLTLNDKVDLATADVTIDLANLGLVNYVTTSGTDDSDNGANNKLILDKLANNGTVVLTGTMDNNSAGIQVNIADAATGTADVLNLVTDVAASDINFGTLTAANVETVNLSANDTKEDDDGNGTVTTAEADAENATLVLTADKATTVNVTGSADVNLTLTGSTKVTAINGSTMTGDLTVTSVNSTSATTITGGAGNDTLVGAADNDVLVGGAGNDKLTAVGELTTLTGGAGNDTFVLNTPDTVNGYATITDLTAGDIIDTSATSFSSAKLTLADTAVFQDYANAAVNSVGASGATWFQFGGNTYLAVDAGADTTSFTNAQDQIIKITGVVDLSTAAFNTTTGDLTIM